MKTIDLAGQRFGSWTVLCMATPDKTGFTRWRCRCEGCQRVRLVRSQSLREGRSTQCNACRVANAKIQERTCRWCGRAGVSRAKARPGSVVVTGGECGACKQQARRYGRDADRRPLARVPSSTVRTP